LENEEEKGGKGVGKNDKEDIIVPTRKGRGENQHKEKGTLLFTLIRLEAEKIEETDRREYFRGNHK